MSIKNYGAIASLDELREHLDRIGDQIFALDIETGYDGPDREKAAIHPETAKLVGISFTTSVDWARYVPLAHDEGDNLDNYQVARLFWPLLRKGTMVAHNAVFELKHLAVWFRLHLRDDPDYGQQVRECNGYFPIHSDTMVEAYLAAEFQRFGLKFLTLQLFGHQMTELYDLFPDMAISRRKFLRFNTLTLEPRVIAYACEDSAWCLAIHQRYHHTLDTTLLYKVEKAIVERVLPPMEDAGLLYDWVLMRRTADRLRTFRDRFNAEIMAELSQLAGHPVAVNLASPPQIADVLFDKLGYRTSVYTDKTRDLAPEERKMSTGKIALERLAQQYPVVQRIREWKQITRLLGTYLEKYENLYNYADDGRAHPNHLSAFVITGRFAHTDPPYAQSPKKYHYDLDEARAAHAAGQQPPAGTCFTFNFRDCIIAPPGHYGLGFDLSQAELRAIAGEANETALLEAFANGEDVHRLTASLMLGIPLSEVTEEQRSVGKAQPLDAGILTPSGWRKLGDITVGDLVIGSDGQAVPVIGIFPQGEKEIFRVTTSDGASTECCGEHLWTVQNVNTKSKIWVTEELRELVAKGIMRSAGASGYSQPKYRLPDRPVVHFATQPELPFDPYVLGLLLGDGGFTHSWAPTYGSADRELLAAVRAEHERHGGRWASETEPHPHFRMAYLAGGEHFQRGSNRIKDELRRLGLWGMRDHEKFVPEIYLLASPQERLAVLQGLMDTDGTVQASGALFRVTSEKLAEAAQFLARSLGGWASIAVSQKPRTPFHVKTDPRPTWSVYLRLPPDMCPFRLHRKAAKWKQPRYRAPQTIASVEPLGSKQTQCIAIAAKNGLYVTDGLLLTHNTMNFALLYGMGVKSLADRLGIAHEEAQSLMDKYFAGMPAIAAYMAKQVDFGRTNGFVLSKFGRRMPIWEYQSDKRWIYQKGDRACVNYPIQGCLPSDTRVLTRAGWTPIGQFIDGSEVWTGAEWALAHRLDKGVAPRVRLHLSDGRTFDCDDRHRLLVKADPWPEWKLATEAVGLPLCQDRNTDWGLADDSSEEDWYWVGRFVGDGALFVNKQGIVVWNMSFNGVKEAGDVERFMAWLDEKPFKTARSKRGFSLDDSALRSGRGKGVKVQGVTAAAVEFWEKHGIVVGTKAKDLRVPEQVFNLDRARRSAFCDGYLDSDGNSKFDGRETYWSKLTSASRPGLEDMLRLFQTIGKTGRIGKPVVLKGRALGGGDYVFYDLWLHRSPAELTIERFETLDAEPMFTLSVDHPRHAFSSEGLISKNSATGDYMKIAMVRAQSAIAQAGLSDKIQLVMNIHDALEFYVHASVEPREAIAVLRPAVVFDVPGWPAMKADWHLFRKWGSPTEIDVAEDGTVTAKGAAFVDLLPGVEEDEDGEAVEVLPEVDVQVLRQAAHSGVGRRVVLSVVEMPMLEVWDRFKALLAGLPGRNSLTIETPQGDIEYEQLSGLSPEHLGQVRQLLPGASLRYVADQVAQLSAGLTL